MIPAPIDLHIGKRIRRRRRLLGLTQAAIADSLHVRFQQIQKFECAANRIVPVHLLNLAHALRVEVGYFFEGFDEGAAR